MLDQLISTINFIHELMGVVHLLLRNIECMPLISFDGQSTFREGVTCSLRTHAPCRWDRLEVAAFHEAQTGTEMEMKGELVHTGLSHGLGGPLDMLFLGNSLKLSQK